MNEEVTQSDTCYIMAKAIKFSPNIIVDDDSPGSGCGAHVTKNKSLLNS